jgi:hypothetical protein
MEHFVDENGCSLLDVDNPREQRLIEDTIKDLEEALQGFELQYELLGKKIEAKRWRLERLKAQGEPDA